MIKYSNGYLAVLYGMKKDYEEDYLNKKIFSKIDYNRLEIKSIFDLKIRESKILKYNKDKLLLISDNVYFLKYILTFDSYLKK